MSHTIDIVLFDLGGVLVDFGGVRAMQELLGSDDEAALWDRWLACEWVRAFERGGCTPEEFAAGVVTDWELPLSPAEYLDEFGSWIFGVIDGAEALVRETAAAVTIGCLSNTNAIHTERHWATNPMFDAFTYRFLSHELGAVKPDPEIFDAVAARLDVPRARVLFLDDNLVNVEGARAAGFAAELAKGPAAARAALETHGVL